MFSQVFTITWRGFRFLNSSVDGTPFPSEQPPFKIKKGKYAGYARERHSARHVRKKGMQYFFLEFYGALVVTTERIAVVRVAEIFRPGEGATCARTDGRNF